MKTKLFLSAMLLFGALSAVPIKAYSQSSGDEIVIPNVFTPNGDGVNDTFRILNLSGSWELMIFDRWGNLVFATQQAQGAQWAGYTLQGKQADAGVYFYTLKSSNSSDQNYHGSVHLHR